MAQGESIMMLKDSLKMFDTVAEDMSNIKGFLQMKYRANPTVDPMTKDYLERQVDEPKLKPPALEIPEWKADDPTTWVYYGWVAKDETKWIEQGFEILAEHQQRKSRENTPVDARDVKWKKPEWKADDPETWVYYGWVPHADTKWINFGLKLAADQLARG
eukprot:2053652-Pyramimonas_sp.AAC.1